MRGRRVQQIDASHDGRDALLGVVDNYGQMVSGQAVAAHDDVVPERGREVRLDVALQTVVELQSAGVDAHADRGVYGRKVAVTTGARVSRRFSVVGRANLAARAAATESLTSGEQPSRCGVVRCAPGALIENGPIPFELESFERPQDLVGRSGHLTWRIDVLDSHEPLAAGLTRVQIARDSGHERP